MVIVNASPNQQLLFHHLQSDADEKKYPTSIKIESEHSAQVPGPQPSFSSISWEKRFGLHHSEFQPDNRLHGTAENEYVPVSNMLKNEYSSDMVPALSTSFPPSDLSLSLGDSLPEDCQTSSEFGELVPFTKHRLHMDNAAEWNKLHSSRGLFGVGESYGQTEESFNAVTMLFNDMNEPSYIFSDHCHQSNGSEFYEILNLAQAQQNSELNNAEPTVRSVVSTSYNGSGAEPSGDATLPHSVNSMNPTLEASKSDESKPANDEYKTCWLYVSLWQQRAQCQGTGDKPETSQTYTAYPASKLPGQVPPKIPTIEKTAPAQDKTRARGRTSRMAAKGNLLKTHKCPVCSKVFKRPLSFKIHYSIHTGLKHYKCEWENCGKYFNVKSNMTRHHKLHLRKKKDT